MAERDVYTYMGDFLKKMELEKAMSRWRWAWGISYLAAGAVVAS